MEGTALIQATDITPELLCSLLHEAVIDHEIQGENDVYVTGLSFNFWTRLDAQRPLLTFSTHWDFVDGVDELEKLRCINALNYDLTMIQFFVGSNPDRLCGYYALPIHDGLDRRQFLRAARMFADIFRTAVMDESAHQMLQPWPVASSNDTLDDEPQKLLN